MMICEKFMEEYQQNYMFQLLQTCTAMQVFGHMETFEENTYPQTSKIRMYPASAIFLKWLCFFVIDKFESFLCVSFDFFFKSKKWGLNNFFKTARIMEMS